MINNEMYNQFVNCAKGIPGFIVGQKEDVPYDITELANGYCQAIDNQDVTKMSQYISALMVRYWHMVVMTYNTSTSTRLDFEDIVMWIYDAFDKACKYRSWLDKSKAVSRDPKGAEKCINQCITSVRQYWYTHFNKDKRKINFMTYSLSEIVPGDINEEMQTTVLDTIEDKSESTGNSSRFLVQNLIDEGSLYEAIVLDGILYQDSFVDDSTLEIVGQDDEGNNIEHMHCTSNFSMRKLCAHLRQLNQNFRNYFLESYIDVDESALDVAINAFTSSGTKKVNNVVNKCLMKLKDNEDIKNYLCM